MPTPVIDDETAEPQTLDEILEWQRGVASALLDQQASVIQAIRANATVPPPFVGMTEEDVEFLFDTHLREVDRLTMLNLVASAEASIKIDFFRRVINKLKDPLSVAYRDWHKTLSAKKQLRPDFDEGGILDEVKKATVMDNHIIGRFRECLRVRNWVGHDRYWAKPVEVDQFDPDKVYGRADQLLNALPDYLG